MSINFGPLTLPPWAFAYPSLLMRHSIMVWADAVTSRHLLILARTSFLLM